MSMYLVVGVYFIVFSFFMWGIGFMLSGLSESYLMEYHLLNLLGSDIGYEMSFDWISLCYMGVVFFISGCVMIFSDDYMKGDMKSHRFSLLMGLFVMSMGLSVFSGGFISLMLGWDGLGLISYVLVIYYQSSSSYKSGMITVLSNRVGDVLLLLCIGLMSGYGSWSFFKGEGVSSSSGLLFIVGACTKSAQSPFSAWLPEAMAAPTPVSSLVHSSTLVTAGVYLLIRLNESFLYYIECKYLLSGLSLVTMMIAGSGALCEMDMKKIIAMSTLSQLGLMMFSLSLGSWLFVYFHSVSHAFFKALSFMCMGSILWGGGGDQDMRLMSGKFKVSFLVNQGLLIAVLCLSGFPFFSGFFSKDLMLELYLMSGEGVFCFSMFSGGFSLSVLYGSRLYLKSSISLNNEKICGFYSEKDKSNLGIFFSMISALVTGSIYSWLEEGVEVIYMGMWLKLSSVFISMSGILLMMILVFEGSKLGIFKGYSDFMGSLWNLSSLSGKSWSEAVKKSGLVVSDDDGWVEGMGGGGVGELSMNLVNTYSMKSFNYLLSSSMSSSIVLVISV